MAEAVPAKPPVLMIFSGWASGIVPSTGLLKVIGKPSSSSRLLTAMAVPWLSCKKLPVSVELWLMRIFAGLAVCVTTMKGSNVVVALMLLIVPAGLFVPHQLSVTVPAP